jgi:hypothetical protein
VDAFNLAVCCFKLVLNHEYHCVIGSFDVQEAAGIHSIASIVVASWLLLREQVAIDPSLKRPMTEWTQSSLRPIMALLLESGRLNPLPPGPFFFGFKTPTLKREKGGRELFKGGALSQNGPRK